MLKSNHPRLALCYILLAATPLLLGSTNYGVDFNARLLQAQNTERARIGVPPLKWDNTLAKDAREWAYKLASTGKFEHSPDDQEKEPQGENLWGGTPLAYSPEEMVGLWIAEKKDYREGTFPYNSRSGDVENVGHYTQVIWRDSRNVGCATAIGRREQVLVCRYSAPGNVIGERPV